MQQAFEKGGLAYVNIVKCISRDVRECPSIYNKSYRVFPAIGRIVLKRKFGGGEGRLAEVDMARKKD